MFPADSRNAEAQARLLTSVPNRDVGLNRVRVREFLAHFGLPMGESILMDEEGEGVARAIVESYDVPWLDDECSAAYSTRFDLIIMRQAYFSSSLEAESTLIHEAAHAARGHHEYFSSLLKSGLIYCVGNSGFVHANGKGTFWEEAFAGLLEGLYRKRYRPGVILRHMVTKLKDPVVTNEFGLQVQFRNTDDGALISLPEICF